LTGSIAKGFAVSGNARTVQKLGKCLLRKGKTVGIVGVSETNFGTRFAVHVIYSLFEIPTCVFGKQRKLDVVAVVAQHVDLPTFKGIVQRFFVVVVAQNYFMDFFARVGIDRYGFGDIALRVAFDGGLQAFGVGHFGYALVGVHFIIEGIVYKSGLFGFGNYQLCQNTAAVVFQLFFYVGVYQFDQ
jgi:hypothetical protein